jgi:serine/threonine-protein kinase
MSDGEIRPGYRLDRYELLCPIAEGGMARVWVARQLGKHGFEKLVAIKTILPKFAADIRFQQMFLDEARLASAIQHSNVARILDLGEEHEVLYIVMEWIDGEALNRVQRALARIRVAIPTGVVLRVMADVCAGLHAAHELRDRTGRLAAVVHRDVSPQNILISTDGVSKVIDFGIAKALDRASGDTTTGTLKGKLHYMAPEQALGQPIDRRADVWAVGAVLYNFFAGRPVYDADSQLTMLHQLTSGVRPPPLPPKVPPPIASVIDGALQHDVTKRWPTTEQMQFALERAMIDLGCPTSASGVAGFLGQYFADRAAARRRTIDMALVAVREQRLASPGDVAPTPPVLEYPRSAASSSGLLDVASRTPASLVTGAKLPTPSGLNPVLKEQSSASLGSAAIDTAPPKKQRGRLGLIVAGGAVAGALALAVVMVPRVMGSGASSAAAERPTDTPAAGAAPTTALPAAAPPSTGVETMAVDPPSAAATEPSTTPSATAMATTRVAGARTPPASRPAPARGGANAAPTPAAAPKPAGGPTKKAIDDGF